ncbi:MAG: hypothetical protein V4539_08465 [Bacteroidota bacterium]
MIKHLLRLSCVCIVFACCSNPSEAPKETTTVSAVPSGNTHCYLYNDSSNIISLRATFQNDSISGALTYDIDQKDKNSGTIVGVVQGDLLVADYTFVSEGKSSVRQVVFKKTGSTLTGGVGEMVEKNGKMVFKDMGKLDFAHAIVLTETDCNK